MKTYIIDALNVVHKSVKLKNLANNSKENAISGLCSEISLYLLRYPSYKMILVVDGKISGINIFNKNITLIESQNNTADNKIKEIIELSQKKSSLEVVSSDTEVYNFARMNAINVILSEDFIKMITPIQSNQSVSTNKSTKNKSGKPIRSSKKEIDELSNLFKNTDNLDLW
jgi:hypothetical protein